MNFKYIHLHVPGNTTFFASAYPLYFPWLQIILFDTIWQKNLIFRTILLLTSINLFIRNLFKNAQNTQHWIANFKRN